MSCACSPQKLFIAILRMNPRLHAHKLAKAILIFLVQKLLSCSFLKPKTIKKKHEFEDLRFIILGKKNWVQESSRHPPRCRMIPDVRHVDRKNILRL